MNVDQRAGTNSGVVVTAARSMPVTLAEAPAPAHESSQSGHRRDGSDA